MSSIMTALEALDAAVELLGAADLRELPALERFVAVDRVNTALRRVHKIPGACRDPYPRRCG